MEWLIKTYSNEGETVLDNCMGSGSTGVAAINNRSFIGIDTSPEYVRISNERIESTPNRSNYNTMTTTTDDVSGLEKKFSMPNAFCFTEELLDR